MDFGKFVGKVAGDISNTIKDANEERKERNRIKQEQEEKERQLRDRILREKLKLLDKFEFPELKKLCLDVLGREPPTPYYYDKKTNKNYELPIDRNHYVEFIVDNFKFSQIKEYALRHTVVPPSFFADDVKSDEQKNEFENIMNAIKSQFEPEKIDDEEHLEAQLMIFLKAKFPRNKIARQVEISQNERLDILIDDKYAFELKVPSQRSVLRDLGAQLEEYSQKYPNTCAIIFDDVERNLSNDIAEYVDKYRRNYNVPSIVLRGERRST